MSFFHFGGKNKGRFFWILSSVLISGCATLPREPVDPKDWIPTEFSAENSDWAPFDEACEWVTAGEVVDGDTVIVEKDRRIRLLGIDTPETNHPKKGQEKWGPEATAALLDLVAAHSEWCLIQDPRAANRDIYGRELRHLFLPDGRNVSETLMCAGWGRTMTFPVSNEFALETCQASAQAAGLNIWQ